MTEQEVIERLGKHRKWGWNKITEKAIEAAITALEEIQQYRAIGTVAEITKKMTSLTHRLQKSWQNCRSMKKPDLPHRRLWTANC